MVLDAIAIGLLGLYFLGLGLYFFYKTIVREREGGYSYADEQAKSQQIIREAYEETMQDVSMQLGDFIADVSARGPEGQRYAERLERRLDEEWAKQDIDPRDWRNR